MLSLRPRLASLALLAASCAFAPGCIKQMLLDGQIEGTREGAKQMDTTADYEVARVAASAGIAQFEGMHRLAPDNTDAYYLLVKNYASFAFAVAEDDMELAYLRGDDEQGDYHKARAASLYTRAIGYGTQWMEKKHPGFDAATKSGREEDMVKYLAKFDDKSDADILFWTGQAWMSRVNATKEIALIGTLYIGKRMVDRVLALDPAYEHGTPHVLLGAAASSTGVATLGPDSFKVAADHFAQAEQLSGGHDLLVKVQRAINYACHMDDAGPGRKGSFELYNKLLGEVLASDDRDPEHRLVNAIAKRRARRYASQKWIESQMADECGWDLDAIQKAMPAK
ncbi:MAG: hypothetical protein NVSMB47_08090 [Polyangiales bacterium]